MTYLNPDKGLRSTDPEKTAMIDRQVTNLEHMIDEIGVEKESVSGPAKGELTRRIKGIETDIAALNATRPGFVLDEKAAVFLAIDHILGMADDFFLIKAKFTKEFERDPIGTVEWLGAELAAADAERQVAEYVGQWRDRINDDDGVASPTLDSLEAVLDECKGYVLERMIGESARISVSTSIFHNAVERARGARAWDLYRDRYTGFNELSDVRRTIVKWREYMS